MKNKPLQVLNIDNWQHGFRAEGLANQHRIMPNLLVVNAQDVFPLNYQARDYDLHEISSVAREPASCLGIRSHHREG